MFAAMLSAAFSQAFAMSLAPGARAADPLACLKRSLGEIASSVLNSIYGDAIRPKMQRLQWASPKWLAEQIGHEHQRMQAVFLAFLPSALASAVVAALPEGTAGGRDRVLLEMARLSEVDAELLAELEELVERCLAGLGQQGATVEGVKQVAERFVRGEKLQEGMLNRVEAVIRCFDPCLSCSTHAMGQMPLHIELRGPGGEVLDEIRR